MRIADIPFNSHIGLEECSDDRGTMCLKYSPAVTNHLGTVHAAAQFALAEACSGQFMLRTFPEYADDHVAVLRKSEVKYKGQAKENVYALASSDEAGVLLFRTRIERKHRAILPVRVVVREEGDGIAMEGTFDWFVQKR